MSFDSYVRKLHNYAGSLLLPIPSRKQPRHITKMKTLMAFDRWSRRYVITATIHPIARSSAAQIDAR